MYQGFYNLASGMLTQSRNLNVISNNMVNLQTAGYKRDKMVSSTFQEEMLYRTGRRGKGTAEPLASTSKIRTASRTYVNYEQGSYEPTEGIYDFAIGGKGFSVYRRQMGFSIPETVPLPWILKDILYWGKMAGCFQPGASPFGFRMKILQWMIKGALQPLNRRTQTRNRWIWGRFRLWILGITDSFIRRITGCSPQTRQGRR